MTTFAFLKHKISACLPYMFWLLLGAVTYGMLIELPPKPNGWAHWDKVQHIGVFMVLTFLACWAFPRRRWLLATVLIIYGAAVEWMQSALTVTRMASLGDWLADVVGVLLVLLGFWMIDAMRRNKVRA
jgi:VanZ family protein